MLSSERKFHCRQQCQTVQDRMCSTKYEPQCQQVKMITLRHNVTIIKQGSEKKCDTVTETVNEQVVDNLVMTMMIMAAMMTLMIMTAMMITMTMMTMMTRMSEEQLDRWFHCKRDYRSVSK